MKQRASPGRAGLLALVAIVLLAHALALEGIGRSLALTTDARQPAPAASAQVRMVQLVAPRPPRPPRPAAPQVSPTPPKPVTAPTKAPTTVSDRPAAEPAPPAPADADPPAAEPGASDAEMGSSVRLIAPPEPVAASEMPTAPEPGTGPPVTLPPDADLKYQVQGRARGLQYRADGELRWRRSDGRYELSMRLSAFLIGSRSQSSVGQLDAGGLLPDRFSDQTRSERAAHFDRVAQRIRFSNNAPEAPLLPGAQDRLSVFLQLAGLLQAGAFQAGDTIELPVAGVGGSERWRFAVGVLEPLDLPAGAMPARRLVREAADTYDSRVEVWLAPELGHLPVRLRITQTSGDVADQQLSQRP